jgi:tetratricopeptide (TPR) repeat protein
MSFRSVLKLGAAALALAAAAGAAHAQSETSRAKIGPSVDTPSLYGAFLAGYHAIRVGDGGDGARLLIEAAQDRPDDQLLRARAFAAALVVGDIPVAARLAPNDSDPQLNTQGLGILTQAVEALAADHGAEADKLLSGAKVGFPNHAAILVLRPYAAAAAGAWDRATAAHPTEGERLVALLDQETRAQLLELRGRYADAEALYKGLAEDSITAGLFAQPYGEFLERRGRRSEAVAVYDKGLASSPGDAGLMAARQRAQGFDASPPPLSLKRAAAEAMTVASGTLASQRQIELSLVYARLALRLDPNNGRAWLLCGDALEAGKDDASARVCWSHVAPGDSAYADALSRLAYNLQRAGDVTGALDAAQKLGRLPMRKLQSELLVADIDRAAERYPEASAALDAVVTGGGGGEWRVLYLRADVRSHLNRWTDAESDLKAALKLAPSEPELLNFLGYQEVDRGEDLKGGLAMIEQAVKAAPNSGAMEDSLGWAHFKLGDYKEAVDELETAVSLEPSDPEINSHLGDAYWMVGRRDEAAFQWRRTLTFEPDTELKASVEAKLKDGLAAKPPAAGK